MEASKIFFKTNDILIIKEWPVDGSNHGPEVATLSLVKSRRVFPIQICRLFRTSCRVANGDTIFINHANS